MIDNRLGGGAACNIIIEENEIIGMSNVGVGIRVGDAPHDDELPTGQFDLVMEHNRFNDLEIGLEIVDGAEENSILVSNNIFHNNLTGISVTSTNADPALPVLANNTLFDNTTAASISLNGNSIPDGLSITNTVAWENSVGYDFTFANSASLDDLLFRNNVAGESSTAGFRSNVAVGSGAIHHMGLKGNTSDIKVGASDGSADRFSSDCVINGSNGEYFSLVNENPSGAGWDFHLLVDDTWSGTYNDLINAGYGTDPSGLTADIGLFGGANADNNIDNNFSLLANYRSVTTNEFFNDVTSWKTDVYRLNIGTPSLNMTSTGTIDGGDATNRTVVEIPSGIELTVADNFHVEYAIFKGVNSDTWKGFKFTSASSIDYSGFADCAIRNATYGLYLTGLDDSSGDRLQVTNCTFVNCSMGVYANNSRLVLTGSTISGSNGLTFCGTAIYLTACSAGKVLIDDCDITGNGTGGAYTSAGIFLYSSSPEIINTLIEDNSGAGITCFASTPDINTWNIANSTDRPNSIHSNGGATQSGSDGSEIYLASSSYPDVQFNNIWDYSGGPVGYMIYKHSSSNSSALKAQNNWWGANPTSSFFYWGGGTAIDYSNYSGSQLSSASRYAQGINAWEQGNYSTAAVKFLDCARIDGGYIGVNSVHYLAGCYAQIPNSNYNLLRGALGLVQLLNQNDEVDWVARRYAVDCYTQMGDFDEALEGYQDMIDDAENQNDMVMAEIDWLSVSELANADEQDATSGDILTRMSNAFASITNEDVSNAVSVPQEFTLNSVYPNPFNSTARVSYSLPVSANVNVTIHDLAGRQIAELFNGQIEAGRHAAVWNAEASAAGVYFVKINAGGTILSEKLLLVK